jgi:hypothetical protein
MATGWPMKTTYADGDVYSSQDVNDITGTINLLGSSVAYAAGKNKIINGAFDIWQRGTTFNAIANGTYTSDRWQAGKDGTATINVSQQTFTPGTAPVAGYEGQYFLRFDVSAWTSSPVYLTHKIENVRTFAGQTVTVSFWAKANSSTTNDVLYLQDFGSGGSGAVVSSTSITIGTSWARYSVTFAIPSISGKTVGTSSSLVFQILRFSAAKTVDVWGVQVEQGSTATAFQTASGTIQGELALCQRYYFRNTGTTGETIINIGYANGSTVGSGQIQFPVPMRVTPTSLDSATIRFQNYGGGTYNMTSVGFNEASPVAAQIFGTISGAVAGHVGKVTGQSAGSYIGLSAEL